MSRAAAEAEAELVRAALLEAGVPEDDFDLTVEGPGSCVIEGCESYHAYLSWHDYDVVEHGPLVWKAFQLSAMKLRLPTTCYKCWAMCTTEKCVGAPLELDCGLAR